MGIESTFACNRLNAIGLAEKGESGFRTSSLPMIFRVSHAQRLPRQQLRLTAPPERSLTALFKTFPKVPEPSDLVTNRMPEGFFPTHTPPHHSRVQVAPDAALPGGPGASTEYGSRREVKGYRSRIQFAVAE
jgi:hypothetical protein